MFTNFSVMFQDYTLNYAIVRVMEKQFQTPIIIYENEDILVIDKPSGLVVHPFDGSTEKTLVDHLKESHSVIFSATDAIFTLQNGDIIHLGGIVHKLDRDTSGVMVVAKNKKTHDELSQQFRNHSMGKKYLAVVEGVVIEDSFVIDAPLGRNKKDYKQTVNPKNPRGELRSAVTGVQVLTRRQGITLLELSPKTGRTHQLRAHMAHIGHPIIGDKAYGSSTSSPRIMLHAKSLSFSLFGEPYMFEVETPEGVFITWLRK
jgi:23S rRNA pseudouridine1911/1915/1917 synthase